MPQNPGTCTAQNREPRGSRSVTRTGRPAQRRASTPIFGYPATVRRRLPVPGLWFALTLSAPLSCTHAEADPLDPSEVESVAKDEGDATGTDRSGAYQLQLTGTPDCDCPMTSEIALCSVDLSTLTVDGVAVTITQSDGYLQLSGVSTEGRVDLSGALDASGEFDLAGIYDLGNVLGDGSLYIRLGGRFTGPDEFTATLLDRADGSYGDQSIDCRTKGEVLGKRVVAEEP